jgi:hypothetical protein
MNKKYRLTDGSSVNILTTTFKHHCLGPVVFESLSDEDSHIGYAFINGEVCLSGQHLIEITQENN